MGALKYGIGRVCATLFPKRRQLVYENFTLPYFGKNWHMDRLDSLIRYYYFERFRQHPDAELENSHRSFWSKQRKDGWYASASDRLHKEYIPSYGAAVDEVAAEAERRGLKTVVEFGTGTGAWLDYLRSRMPAMERFVGVDIAESQLAENRQRFSQLEFVCQDMLEWARSHNCDGTLYHTNSGVFEYLTEASLRELLIAINKNSRNHYLFLIEPVHREYDLSRETSSRALGYELTYSHNYPRLLPACGYELIKCDVVRSGDYDMLLIQASSNSSYQ